MHSAYNGSADEHRNRVDFAVFVIEFPAVAILRPDPAIFTLVKVPQLVLDSQIVKVKRPLLARNKETTHPFRR